MTSVDQFKAVCAVCVAVFVILSAHAHAQPLGWGTTYYEIGPAAFQGGHEFHNDSSTVQMQGSGVRIYERNGPASRAFGVFSIGIIMGLASGNKKHLGSETKYINGAKYRVDYYRDLTPAEKAAQRQRNAAALNMASKADSHTELIIYWPSELLDIGPGGDAQTAARGFYWNYMPWDVDGDGYRVEFGFLIASITDQQGVDENDPSVKHERTYSNFGSPIRVMGRLSNLGFWDVQWDLNWLAAAEPTQFVSHRSPLRASVTLAPIQRLFLRGGVQLKGLTTNKPGYHLAAGMRF